MERGDALGVVIGILGTILAVFLILGIIAAISTGVDYSNPGCNQFKDYTIQDVPARCIKEVTQ